MVADRSTDPDADTPVATPTRMVSRRRIGWLVFLLVAAGLGVGVVRLQTLFWPSEMEQEIRLDLISSDHIEEGARVSVVNELRLFSFYSRFGPQRFVTLCIQDDDDRLHLAYARCWREGMRWHTDPDRWQLLTEWPSADQIRAFEDAHADVVAPALETGHLPRPPGTEGFQLTHLAIRVSDDIPGFEPNDNVDPVAFAAVLNNGIGLGSFAFAKFHEPRWHSASDGIEAIDKSIERLQQMSGEPECQVMDCDSLLEVLQVVKERLQRAAELHLTFYFLATDHSLR